MKRKSIYENIKENLTVDGLLPNDFSLQHQEASPNELRFMPGAKDGIGIFHAGTGNPENAADCSREQTK